MPITGTNEYRYWKTLRAIGFALLIFLLLLNLVSLVVTGLNLLLPRLPISAVTSHVIYQLFYAAGYLTAFMVPVAFLRLIIRKSGYEYQPMRSQAKLSPWLPLILFGGVAVVWSLAYLNSAMVSIFRYAEFSSDMLWGSSDSEEWYAIVLQFIVMCLVPAFCEEFLFRGAILTNCLPFGRGTAVFISALLFGLMHQNAEQIFYAFGAGLVLGLVYERTGSIWNCVFLHLFNNFLSVFEPLFAQSFGARFSGVSGALFEMLLIGIGCVCALILVFRFAPRKPLFKDGIFGKPVPADDAYASCPVTAKQAFKRFINVPMVIFFSLVLLQILLLIGMAVLYHG